MNNLQWTTFQQFIFILYVCHLVELFGNVVDYVRMIEMKIIETQLTHVIL